MGREPLMNPVIIKGPLFNALVSELRRCCHDGCLAPDRCRWWWDNRVCHNDTKDMTPTQYAKAKRDFAVIKEACRG